MKYGLWLQHIDSAAFPCYNVPVELHNRADDVLTDSSKALAISSRSVPRKNQRRLRLDKCKNFGDLLRTVFGSVPHHNCSGGQDVTRLSHTPSSVYRLLFWL